MIIVNALAKDIFNVVFIISLEIEIKAKHIRRRNNWNTKIEKKMICSVAIRKSVIKSIQVIVYFTINKINYSTHTMKTVYNIFIFIVVRNIDPNGP